MLATAQSATLIAIDGHPVTVEAYAGNGIPGLTLVGLPDASCRESRDRARAAILSSGLRWPQRRVTVNLAPSGLRKVGSGLDLAIAVALLAADGQIEREQLRGLAFFGELGLDGSLRTIPGVISLVGAVDALEVVVPGPCHAEASLVRPGSVRSVASLRQLVAVLQGVEGWPAPPPGRPAEPAPAPPELADVRGQVVGCQAVEVAAAGLHNLLLFGPPGAGKTMLATRLPGLLPPLDPGQAIEVTRVHSAAGLALPSTGLVERPPFRAPHHRSSAPALVGGGSGRMRPGEVSCAHHGVLFLDELAEFPSAVLDTLRQPIEEGVIRVSRAAATVAFPARFLLVAATNPCPCGGGDGTPGSCRCSEQARARYLGRLSGPLLDRFDLRVPVRRPDPDELLGSSSLGLPASTPGAPGPAGGAARRVLAARGLARARGVPANSHIPAERLEALVPLTPAARRLLEVQLMAGRISARGLHRVRRVARTLADLAGQDGCVGEEHVALALALRAELVTEAGVPSDPVRVDRRGRTAREIPPAEVPGAWA